MTKIFRFSLAIIAIFFLTVLSNLKTATAGDCPQPRETPKAPDEIYNLPLKIDNTHVRLDGQDLYERDAKPIPCGRCHGMEGKGNGDIGKAFKSPAPRDFTCIETMKEITPGQMFWIIKNGSPGTGMAPHSKTLTDEQIWQIISYIRAYFLRV